MFNPIGDWGRGASIVFHALDIFSAPCLRPTNNLITPVAFYPPTSPVQQIVIFTGCVPRLWHWYLTLCLMGQSLGTELRVLVLRPLTLALATGWSHPCWKVFLLQPPLFSLIEKEKGRFCLLHLTLPEEQGTRTMWKQVLSCFFFPSSLPLFLPSYLPSLLPVHQACCISTILVQIGGKWIKVFGTHWSGSETLRIKPSCPT